MDLDQLGPLQHVIYSLEKENADTPMLLFANSKWIGAFSENNRLDWYMLLQQRPRALTRRCPKCMQRGSLCLACKRLHIHKLMTRFIRSLLTVFYGVKSMTGDRGCPELLFSKLGLDRGALTAACSPNETNRESILASGTFSVSFPCLQAAISDIIMAMGGLEG